MIEFEEKFGNYTKLKLYNKMKISIWRGLNVVTRYLSCRTRTGAPDAFSTSSTKNITLKSLAKKILINVGVLI